MTDPRTAAEYRVPATSLKPGDLVNTSPGEDDWQEVVAVHRSGASGGDAALQGLVDSLGGRYVVVALTDLMPVDSGVYFGDDGAAMIAGDDGDQAVTDAVSQEDGQRIYLYTRYELVTVRAATA
ncbi:MAG TPA: hypothetical protein VGN35_01270 [Jatrophihabitantaceae bacterium]|jgi:hypothetical protein|nr:hypothetical protein [Jatrophihabitantaceae bacterium]